MELTAIAHVATVAVIVTESKSVPTVAVNVRHPATGPRHSTP